MRIFLSNNIRTPVNREKMMNVMGLLATIRHAQKISCVIDELNIENISTDVFGICSIYSTEQWYVRKERVDQFLNHELNGTDAGYIVACFRETDFTAISIHIGKATESVVVLALLHDPVQRVEAPAPPKDNVVIVNNNSTERKESLSKAKIALITAALMAIMGIGLVAAMFWR